MSAAATQVLGVLNATPDSFSDGNQFLGAEAAVARGLELVAQGAHIVDVGGESTRPGADAVSAAEEQRRVIPVVRELASRGVVVSIDTIKASTAEAAVLAGARIVNDVSGGHHDPAMADTVARLCANIDGVTYIVGHWRGIPDAHHERSSYADVVREVADGLAESAQRAIEAGVPAENIVIDPGLGFDKTTEQGWLLLRRIDELQALGFRVLVGVSRKRMLADIAGAEKPATERDLATSVVSALCARAGVWGVRVHDVPGTVQAIAVESAWRGDAQAPSADRGDANEQATRRSEMQAHAAVPARQQPTLTTIALTGLEVFAHHGVFDFERRDGQRFIIDASVRVDVNGARDDLSQTVHYGELAEAIVRAAETDPVDLIETLAERVLGVAFGFAGVHEATVTVHKPEAPITVPFGDVSVTMSRSRYAD